MNEGTNVCAACSMHKQKCTFLEDPRPRKRRVDDGSNDDTAKKRYVLRVLVHAVPMYCVEADLPLPVGSTHRLPPPRSLPTTSGSREKSRTTPM